MALEEYAGMDTQAPDDAFWGEPWMVDGEPKVYVDCCMPERIKRILWECVRDAIEDREDRAVLHQDDDDVEKFHSMTGEAQEAQRWLRTIGADDAQK